MTYEFQRQTLETTHKSIVEFSGGFLPNGSSACSASHIRANWILSVAHTATGVYTVTMKSEYRNLQGVLSAVGSLRIAGTALSWGRIGAIDLSAGTIVCYTFTEASDTTALADITQDAGSSFDIILQLQYAPIVDGSGITT
jgi:hypothetical protein